MTRIKPKTGKAEAHRLTLVIEAAGWSRVRGLEERLRSAFDATLAALPPSLRRAAQRAEVTVLLTSNAAVRRLNRDFRGLDKPTNVLSFPQMTRAKVVSSRGATALPVGDIAIAYQYVVDEAKKDNKIVLDHVTHLTIHGILHLFGYNHMTDPTARVMERLEQRVMASLGLGDPYAVPRGRSARPLKRLMNA